MVYVKSQGATKVRQAIDRGYVTNQEISATLGGLERSLGGDRRTTLHDEIAGASRYYTLMPRPGFIGRCYLAGKDIADRVASLSSVAYGAATGACYQFGAALANTSLGGVVNPKTALYELITKGKFKVSGEVGFDALLTPITAMPQVIIGVGVGAVAGWAAYKLATRTAGYLWNTWRKNVTSRNIATKYQLGSAPAPQPVTPSAASTVVNQRDAQPASPDTASNFIPFQ